MTRRRIAIVASLALVALAVWLWFAWQRSGPQVAGSVELVEPDPEGVRLLVNSPDNGRCWVEVSPAVRISGAASTITDLAVGQRVRAWYDGTMFATEPPIVHATRLVVEK